MVPLISKLELVTIELAPAEASTCGVESTANSDKIRPPFRRDRPDNMRFHLERLGFFIFVSSAQYHHSGDGLSSIASPP
jgi:hypothetical protein